MKPRCLLLIPVIATAVSAQTESAVRREGRYWVQTVTGTMPLEGATALRVSNRGSITLTGEARPDVSYTLTRKARGGEQEARQALSRVAARVTRQGQSIILSVPVRDAREVSADLRVAVPRALRETEIESQGGALEARDLDGSLRADTGGGQVRFDRIQGGVTVNTGGGNIQLGTIGGTVLCSTGGGRITADSVGGQSSFSTGGGEILVRQAGGPVRASTGGGSVRVERANGPVTASTGGGSIEVMQAEGPVVADSGAGGIKLRGITGVRCDTGSGAIELVSVSGSLRVATGMGSVLAELASGKRLEDSAISTGHGDITVYIPSNLAVTVRARNESPGLQKIVSDFPEIRAQLQSRGEVAEATGSLNGGGPVLRLTATGGTIYLRRQK